MINNQILTELSDPIYYDDVKKISINNKVPMDVF
jgi:hypothetical protein